MGTSKRSRFLAAFLAVVMIFTLLPMGAFAEDIKPPAAAKNESLDEPTDGAQIVIYNASAGGVFGMPNDDDPANATALDCASAFISNCVANPDSGARVFTVGVIGSDYTFKSGDLYLASDDAENLFLTDDETANIKWNLEKGADGYVIYSKDSRYTFSGGSSSKVCIEYYGGSFLGWTYKAAEKAVYEMQFYPVADDVPVVEGIVNKPEVVLASGDAYIGADYKLQFSINALFGYHMPSVTLNGEAIARISLVSYITADIPAEKVVGDELVFTVTGTDKMGVPYDTTLRIPVIHEPVVTDLTPSENSVTGDNKFPIISAKIVNGGESPDVTMTVNKKVVDAVFENGIISYTPAADMPDGEVSVTVNVTREDGKTAVKTWSFNVGDVTYNPVMVSDIADVQAQTESGYKCTVEGVVTTNASDYDKNTAFFDCIYIQDETGGLCCFPVAGDYKIGDKVRITGTADFYQGEMELQVTSIQKIGEGETVTAREVSAKQINDCSVLGQFIALKGTVQSFALENGLVQTIMVKDAKGEVARVFIDGYICADKDIENLKNGCEITVMGVASYDDTFNAPEGPFPRIRINDRNNIVVGNPVEDPFTDIISSGYHDNIVEAANAGIINGYPDNTFRPKADVTRAQFITMLYRSVGSPAAEGTLSFADAGSIVGAYKDAVIWGVQNGIIAGYGDNTFRPNLNISRAQMATFLYRYLKNVADYDFGKVSAVSFADAGYIAGSYKDAVNAIVSAGIMNGTGNNMFSHNGTANRGMAATVILRVYNLLNN